MVPKIDELKDSTDLMEYLLREQLGGSDAKYRKVVGIIEKFNRQGQGDIYFERYEDKLIKMLESEVFKYESN